MHSTSAIALNGLLMQDTVMSEKVKQILLTRPGVDLMEAHAVSTEKFPEVNLAFLMELFERVGMLSFRIIDKDEFWHNMRTCTFNV